MTFGISCAPCIAHYVRDKNAEEYKLQSPRAFEAITKAHYVDDYILVDSLGDETEAIEVTLKVRDIHAAGGFNIRDWASNSPEVLKHLQSDSLDLQSPKELGDPEKVLGMFWEPDFQICTNEKKRPFGRSLAHQTRGTASVDVHI